MLKTTIIVTFIKSFLQYFESMRFILFLYNRLKRTDNFEAECVITVFCHFPGVTPINFNKFVKTAAHLPSAVTCVSVI